MTLLAVCDVIIVVTPPYRFELRLDQGQAEARRTKLDRRAAIDGKRISRPSLCVADVSLIDTESHARNGSRCSPFCYSLFPCLLATAAFSFPWRFGGWSTAVSWKPPLFWEAQVQGSSPVIVRFSPSTQTSIFIRVDSGRLFCGLARRRMTRALIMIDDDRLS